MSRQPVRSCGPRVFPAASEAARKARADHSASRGWTLLELVIALAVMGVLVKMSLPSIQNSILAYRLGAGASSAAAAIQQTRFLAIKLGCKHTVAFTAGSNAYRVQWQRFDETTTPPACASTYYDVANNPTVAWTSAGSGIRVTSSPTLLFDPGGIVYTQGSPPVMCTPCSVQVSNGSATKTVTISGVGNVKVTSP